MSGGGWVVWGELKALKFYNYRDVINKLRAKDNHREISVLFYMCVKQAQLSRRKMMLNEEMTNAHSLWNGFGKVYGACDIDGTESRGGSRSCRFSHAI